jgi:pilus assembly protein Flp/PilA
VAVYAVTWSMQMSKVFAFLKDESGATAIEYGLIAAGISVMIITAVQAVGVNLNTTFRGVADALAGN